MFLSQAFISDNRFWKYIMGGVIIIIFSLIGQIPWLAAIFIKASLSSSFFPKNQSEMILYLDSNLTLFFMLLSFVFALFGIVIVVKGIHKQAFIKVTTSRKKVDWNRVFFSFGLWTFIVSITVLVDYWIHPDHYIFNFKPLSFIILVFISIIFIPIQTSAEEYFFRGYLMQGFGLLTKNKWAPLLLTSFIFGCLHIANPEVEKIGYIILFYYIGTGLFLGIVTLMDEGLELGLGFHAANNLITALLVTSDWTVFQTNSLFKDMSDPNVSLDVIAPVLIIFPILLFFFGKKYKWRNWKEKLTGKIEIQNRNTISDSCDVNNL